MAIGSRRTTPTAPVAAAVVSEPIVAPTNTPCSKSRLWNTSGATRGAAAAEHDRGQRNALRVLPAVGHRRALARRDREARVRVGGLAGAVPGLALPVDEVRRWRALVLALPPRDTARGHGDVREDRVVGNRRERVRVRVGAGAGDDAEEAGLGVDRPEPAVGPRPQPGDVVAHGPHPVALRLERRDEHREVRLAAGRGKRGADVVRLAAGQLELEDQHVLGEPALVARHRRRDAQREALLAEKRVAPVPRADAPDRPLLGEVDDEAPLRARGRRASGRPARSPLPRRVGRGPPGPCAS